MLTQNNILFKKELYPFRQIELEEFGVVLISISSLNDKLLTTSGNYSSRAAQYLDEKIFYFVDDDKITLSAAKLKQLILSEVS